MVRKKTQSKRVTSAKKFRIEKKVTEHRRKERREARKNPKSKKLKKDPGIPNLWPFKDKLLHQIEEQKRKVEDEKQRQKQDRQSLHNKNRNLNFTALVKDATKRNSAFTANEQAVKEEEEDNSVIDEAVVVGQKDNSRKAYYKEFKKVIENADVILEILDARDPLGCRTKQIERMIMDSGLNKRIILVLNKIDLVPRENLAQWLTYLRNEYPTIAFKSSTQAQRKNLSRLSGSSTNVPDNILHSSECLGADTLVKLLKNYCRNSNIKTSITVGVIGYPNVGKSSVINSLKRSKVCGVGATPGLTKTAQEIHLDKNIKLLDSPGIVFSRGQWSNYAEILLRNCVKIELLDDPITPVELIVSRCKPEQLMNRYNIPMYRDTNDFLGLLARQRGKLRKGGIPDLQSAAKSVLQDWNSGKIPFYTTPPIKPKALDETTVVSTWSKEFSLDELIAEDNAALEASKTKSDFGPSAMVMMGQEVPEIEMEVFDEEEEDEDSKIFMDEDEIAPDAVPIGLSEPIVSHIKPKVVFIGVKGKMQQILTPVEKELNPQHGKNLKKAAKVAKKSKMKDSNKMMKIDEDIVNDKNDTENDGYDFGEFFGKLEAVEKGADEGIKEEDYEEVKQEEEEDDDDL
ncbi:hypothetical protein G9A89_019361 [Geosiphon pyriformis]|nr:hypothetical protein G9A89_019361 [Geosiphon pyriformis]